MPKSEPDKREAEYQRERKKEGKKKRESHEYPKRTEAQHMDFNC